MPHPFLTHASLVVCLFVALLGITIGGADALPPSHIYHPKCPSFQFTAPNDPGARWNIKTDQAVTWDVRGDCHIHKIDLYLYDGPHMVAVIGQHIPISARGTMYYVDPRVQPGKYDIVAYSHGHLVGTTPIYVR